MGGVGMIFKGAVTKSKRVGRDWEECAGGVDGVVEGGVDGLGGDGSGFPRKK